ncbi:hypothetical protein PybrP1_012422 [[Pythium] brassicae (nom. inval.)]|nr:hypothetical protein PybrP1_012422 [[Pythium] brassicae (nom. inval.)]
MAGYIEVVVPILYAIYTVVLFHLLSAKYYRYNAVAHTLNILVSAFMELLSTVYVHYALHMRSSLP